MTPQNEASDTTLAERRVTLRIPPILGMRLARVIEDLQDKERKISMNEWIVEAIRQRLDGETEPTAFLAAAAESARKTSPLIERTNRSGVGIDPADFLKKMELKKLDKAKIPKLPDWKFIEREALSMEPDFVPRFMREWTSRLDVEYQLTLPNAFWTWTPTERTTWMQAQQEIRNTQE